METHLNRIYWKVYVAMCVWSLFIFTSFSVSALGHILILISFLYLAWVDNTWIPEGFKSKSSKVLTAIVLIGIFSVLANWGEIERPIKNIIKLKYYLLAVLAIPCFELVRQNFLNEKRVRLLLNLFFISLIVANLSGFYAVIFDFHPLRMKAACHESRACGMYGMYMTYGYGIQFVAVLLMGMLFQLKNIRKHFNNILFYLALITSVIGLFWSLSRGAWLGFLAAIPFFFLKQYKKKFLIAVTSIIVLSFGSFLFIPKVKNTFFNESRLNSNAVRISQFKTAIYAFKENPILGKGHRNFEPQTKDLKQKYNIEFPQFGGHAHNNFFEDLASKGILGLFALIAFHLFWLIETYKREDILGYLAFPIVIAFFVSGQFQYTFGDGENLFLLMFIYSLSQLKPMEKKLVN